MIEFLNRNKLFIPFALVALNFVIKWIYIDYGDIAGDEPFTLFYAQVGIDQFSAMLEQENNPPLFFLLTHFWIKLFGIEAAAVRTLPLIFSVFTAPFVYLIGKKFVNLRTGLIAALLFSFSSYSIYFAHETRVYSLFGLLTASSMYGFLSIVNQPASKKYFWLFIVSNTLLIYSHFFGFFVFAIQGLSLLLIKDYGKHWKKVFIGFLISGALYLPYLPTFLSRFMASSGGTWVREPNIKSLYYVLKDFSNVPVSTVIFLLIIGAGGYFAVFKSKNKIAPITKSVFLWFFFPYITMFLVSFKLPMFIDRYLTHVSIAFFLLIAIAIDQFKEFKKTNITLSGLTVLLIIVTTDLKSGHLPNRKSLVEEVLQNKDEKTAVIICPPWLDLEIIYHYNLDYFKDFKNSKSLFRKDNFFAVYNSKLLPPKSEIRKFNKIIYLDSWSHLTDPDKTILNYIESNFGWTHTNESYDGYKIHYYRR